MPMTTEVVRGTPLLAQPASISRCGMSRAKFAKRRMSEEWYKLSDEGRSIGTPTDFDFYMAVEGRSSEATADVKRRELARVEGAF